MAVSASLTIPVTVTNPSGHEAIAAVFLSALGSSDISVDRYAAKVTLRFQFPGDIDPVMRELYRRGLTHSATVALSIGVANPQGGTVDVHGLVERLGELQAVSNVSFDSGVVSATVAAATDAMRSLHDAIVEAGLVPVDMVARGRAS
jgi:hypothetical protein